MSVKIISQVWDTPCPSHTSKLVLVALADNANDQHVCWPSLDYLADKCDLSRQGVIIQIGKLEMAGLLAVERSDGRAVNRYIVLPRNCQRDGQGGVNTVDRGVSTVRQGGVNGVDRGVSMALTDPVNGVDSNRKEPSVQPSKEPRRGFAKPTVEEVKAFCLELGVPASDGESFWLGKEGNGWRNGSAPIRDWKATLRNWKLQKFLPSQKASKEAMQRKPELHFEL